MALLRARELTKTFGSVRALAAVRFEIVRRASEEGTTVRAIGSCHSWSDVALGVVH